MTQIEEFEDYMSRILSGSDKPSLTTDALLSATKTSTPSFVQRTNLRMANIRKAGTRTVTTTTTTTRAPTTSTTTSTPTLPAGLSAVKKTIPDALATVRNLFDSTQLKANGASSTLSAAVEKAIANGNSAVSEIISLTKKALGLT
jgi:hypothetical protein